VQGNELLRKVAREKMPDREQVRLDIKQTDFQKQYNKRPLIRSAVAFAATAAIIVCVLLISVFSNTQMDNMFTIRAYAMEQHTDGSVVLREIDLVNQQDVWGGYFDGENLFINIALQPVGENIQSVEFRIDTGFFAKQYIVRENGVIVLPENAPWLFVGDDNIAMFGTDFEIMGSSFTFFADEITEDLLLFWGQEWDETTRPQNVIVYALAIFNDGGQQEEIFELAFGDGVGIVAADFSDRVRDLPPYYLESRPTDREITTYPYIPMFRFAGTVDNVIVEHSLDGGQTWISGMLENVTIPATVNLPREYIIGQKQIWMDAGFEVPDWLMELYNSNSLD
jgi:hypothetical protein